MARREFWRQVRSSAWEKSREHFAWMYPVVTGAAVWLVSGLLYGWDRAVSDLGPVLIAAAVSVVTAVIVYCVNVVRAGAQIHAENLSNISRIEAEKLKAEADLDEIRLGDQKDEKVRPEAQNQNLGIKVDLSRMEVFYNEEGLDGVMVAIVIQRIVNRNTADAAIEITLHAPFVVGGIPMSVSTVGESLSVPYIALPHPLLPPLINVKGKSGIGPGYMLFHFSRAQLTGSLLATVIKGLPVTENVTDEKLAEMLWQRSEMEVRIEDLAGSDSPQRVPAPGTARKRQERLAKRFKTDQAAADADAVSTNSTMS